MSMANPYWERMIYTYSVNYSHYNFILKLQCYCYVCDEVAPCVLWKKADSSGHCHASDKEENWNDLRLSTRNKQQNNKQKVSTKGKAIDSLPTSRSILTRSWREVWFPDLFMRQNFRYIWLIYFNFFGFYRSVACFLRIMTGIWKSLGIFSCVR